MGLVDDFGGKISGELVRADDWNGMLAAIEGLITTRIAPLEAAVAALAPRVSAAEAQLAELAGVAETLRTRYCRLTLQTPFSQFAIGQRATITAKVANFDGTPLQPGAARPWVDFVTAWGTLSAVPGFVSRAGTDGQTLSVQVDANGEAKVLLQAHHAKGVSPAEHLQFEGIMGTTISSGGAQTKVSQAILGAPTPGSDVVKLAFKAITQAYVAPDKAAQKYLDAYYLEQPGIVATDFGASSWTDYMTTVFAFVKPDADATSPDGAMASGAIQVTFRDWVRRWLRDDFFKDLTNPIKEWRELVPGLMGDDLPGSVKDILNEFEKRTKGGGVLGGQRQLQAGVEAANGLKNTSNPLPFFKDAMSAVASGLTVQSGLSYAQAVLPGEPSATSAGLVVAGVSTHATGQAERVGEQLGKQFQVELAAATKKLGEQSKADQQVFQAQLLRDDGPIANARKEARDVRGALETVKNALGNKADLNFVTEIVRR